MCEATIKTLTVYIVRVSNFKRKKMAIAIQNALTQRASSLDTVQMVCFKHQVTPVNIFGKSQRFSVGRQPKK